MNSPTVNANRKWGHFCQRETATANVRLNQSNLIFLDFGSERRRSYESQFRDSSWSLVCFLLSSQSLYIYSEFGHREQSLTLSRECSRFSRAD